MTHKILQHSDYLTSTESIQSISPASAKEIRFSTSFIGTVLIMFIYKIWVPGFFPSLHTFALLKSDCPLSRTHDKLTDKCMSFASVVQKKFVVLLGKY